MTTLTVAERAMELFGQRPTSENRIDWLANQLLDLAAESHFISCRIVPGEGEIATTLECRDSGHAVGLKDVGPLRLFRTLLARFAKMAEEENGTQFNPYGGQLHFNRPISGAPVRLNVEFANTKEIQYLAIVKATRAA
ncbi:MAG: hypothetical protein K8U57_26305 [Planctomycetes bacterium]|nr:hypothetical protein [Planctomycetota bacterium]